MNADGLCICAVLFGGPSCEVSIGAPLNTLPLLHV